MVESRLITGPLGAYLSEKMPILSRLISLLQSPGIPWNLDVSLLALVYLALGFFYKNQIKSMMQSKSRRYDIAAIALSIALAVLCYFNFRSGESAYYFDMKPVQYHELVSAIIIPCIFGFVLIRFTLLISKIKVIKWLFSFLVFLGQMTLPIMFIHIPINTFQTQIDYGSVLYVLFGIGVPLAVVVIFKKYPAMRKLLGIPDLDNVRSKGRVGR